MANTNTTASVVDEFTYFHLPGTMIGTFGVVSIEITSWLVSAYDFYSRVVKDR